jgi:hypothetical protein
LESDNDSNNKNTSAHFYKDLSSCEPNTKINALQHWFEENFTKQEEYKSIFLSEETFDIAAKNFNIDLETDDLTEDIIRINHQKLDLKLEVLTENSNSNNEIISLVFWLKDNKGSAKTEDSDLSPRHASKKKATSWSRTDLNEKRVIRAFSDVVKDYFNDIAKAHNAVSNLEKLTWWDKLIQECFPNAFKTSRLKILGQICVNTIGWKFATKINSLKTLNAYQRKQLLRFGDEFRKQRNSSMVEERKLLLNHSIIRIGKLLYENSAKYESAFWKHIDDHKKSQIEDAKTFKEVHKALIARVPSIEYQGDLFAPNLILD